MIRISSNEVSADAPKGSEIGTLSIVDQNGNEYPAIFMVADHAAVSISDNKLIYSGDARQAGTHSIDVSAMYLVRRQVSVPHVGISIALSVEDPSGCGGAAISHGVIDDPTGAYAILGGVLVPKTAVMTIETRYQTKATIEIVVQPSTATVRPPKK